jgi:hypothetical protein
LLVARVLEVAHGPGFGVQEPGSMVGVDGGGGISQYRQWASRVIRHRLLWNNRW